MARWLERWMAELQVGWRNGGLVGKLVRDRGLNGKLATRIEDKKGSCLRLKIMFELLNC